LLKWLRKEFEELLEALKNGKFAEWIREKLRLLFDNKEIDDILNADYLSKWDDLPVRRKGYLGGNVLKRQVQEWIRKIKSKGKIIKINETLWKIEFLNDDLIINKKELNFEFLYYYLIFESTSTVSSR
jgi:hypothetical protein